MENRNTLFIALAVFGILILGGYIGYLVLGAQPSELPPTPAPRAVATLPPTFTPTPTTTPFVFSTPTPLPPTITPTPTATHTPEPENTPTNTPVPRVVVRLPTQTPTVTPIPSNTPVVITFPFRVESGPFIDRGFACKNQYMVHGNVRDQAGRGLAGVLIRYVQQFPTVREITGTTEPGNKSGFDYELTLGTSGNEWDIYLVDANGNQLSPSVHLVTNNFGGGDCWWQLHWRRN